MSQSSARWNDPPITQPLHATMIGASRSHTCWIPRCPRRISSWCDSSTFRLPIEPTSRPDENDLPSPRQITAWTSGCSLSSPRTSNSSRSMSSSNALCLSGLSFVIVAIGPSIVRCTRESGRGRRVYGGSGTVGPCATIPLVSTVRAGVFPGDGSFDVREFAAPETPPGGAVLAVEAVGLCGSDLAQLDGVMDVPGQQYPVVPGHEIVGRIAKITPEAAAVWRLAEGDRVCVDEIVRCGSCGGCRAGTFCFNMQLYGYTMTIDDGPGLWGGYGEQMALLPGTNLYKVPDDIPAVELTMFEPLASAVNWVQRVGVQLGDTVVVQGPGHQGLACVMAARAAGATQIIVTGTSADG